MRQHCSEPALSDALADSVVQAMMAADSIELAEFESFLRRMARKVHRGTRRAAPCANDGWNTVPD
jgi:hypothetical protein